MNQTQFQALLEKQIGAGGIQNIVMRVQSSDGGVDLAGAAGFADANGQTPMTVDTPYPIASVSKTYTVAMIMKLVEQGALDLDQPIAAYLPAALVEGIHVYQGQDYSQQIRVVHLVAQTSGLPDYFEDKPKGGRSLYDDLKHGAPDRAYTTEELLDIVRGIPARFAPGAKDERKAHYADTNYHLLGKIIEAVTGLTYAEALQRMICEPLGLRHTYAFDASQPRDPRPATIWFKQRVMDVPLFLSSHAAEGGIISTTAEGIAFLRAFFEGRLFDKRYLERMTRQWNGIFYPLQYGYGLMRFKLPRLMSPFQPSPELIGHSGSTGTFTFYSPDRQLYIAGGVNQATARSKPFRLMIQVANKVRT